MHPPSMEMTRNIGPQEPAESQEQSESQAPTNPYRSGYFWCYLFFSFSQGIAFFFPAALFNELESQLNASELEVSYIVMTGSIGVIVGALASADIIDRYKETHLYCAIIIMMEICVWCSIPLIKHYWIQIVIWAIGGICRGTKAVAMPVFTYRYFKEKASTMFIAFCGTVGVGQICSALIIQLAVHLFGDFMYAMFCLSAVPASAVILLLILDTPQHDDLRSIEDAMKATGLGIKSASAVHEELKQHQTLKLASVGSLQVFFFFFGFIRSGIFVHISVYCEEYLKVSPGIGRYLLATYSTFLILYRLLKAFCLNESTLKHLNSIRMTWRYLWLMVITLFMLLLLWIAMPFEHKIPTLFVVFGAAGFITSGIPPSVYRLTDPITPISGKITSLGLVLYYIGEMTVVFINGSVIDAYGARPYPWTALVGSALGVPIILISLLFRRKILKIRTAAIKEVLDVQRHCQEQNVDPQQGDQAT